MALSVDPTLIHKKKRRKKGNKGFLSSSDGFRGGERWMLEEPSREAGQWVRMLSTRAKVGLGAILDVVIVVLSWLLVKDHDYIFVAAESAHVAGVSVLIYKLLKNRTCSGLSLKSQELTAIYLAFRIYCSYVMEYDVHTILDSATLLTTLWVVYMIRFVVRSSYLEGSDNFEIYYVCHERQPCFESSLWYSIE